MTIAKKKHDDLSLRMQQLEILETDIVEKFILGSGKGGQKVNKTSSCVYLKHLPSGIEVKCQRNRSREENRYLARKELCEKIEKIRFQKASLKEQEFEKIRRQKRRRSRKQKEKMLVEKKHRGTIKKMRQDPTN